MGVVEMTGLEWVLAALAIIVIIGIGSLVALAFVIRAIYRRIRYSRSVGGALLRTRARLSRGPQRQVLALRLQLQEMLDSGQAAADLAARSGPRSELPRLFRRIRQEGAALDAQLRFLESETDTEVLAEEVPAAGRRVEQVALLVHRLRSAVAAGLTGLTDDTLTGLRSDMELEVAALHAGVEELHALNRLDVHQPISSTVRDKENPS
jgi:hypothetical protein